MAIIDNTGLRRYLVVTAVSTPANVAVIWALLASTEWHPLICNLLSATAVTIPTFFACALWVWPQSGPAPGRAAAYWTSSLVNVALASLAVAMAGRSGADDSVLAFVPFAAYTFLWVGRFFFLDRIVFARRRANREGAVVGTP